MKFLKFDLLVTPQFTSFLKPLVAKMNGKGRRGYVMTRQKHFELEKKHLRKPES